MERMRVYLSKLSAGWEVEAGEGHRGRDPSTGLWSRSCTRRRSSLSPNTRGRRRSSSSSRRRAPDRGTHQDPPGRRQGHRDPDGDRGRQVHRRGALYAYGPGKPMPCVALPRTRATTWPSRMPTATLHRPADARGRRLPVRRQPRRAVAGSPRARVAGAGVRQTAGHEPRSAGEQKAAALQLLEPSRWAWPGTPDTGVTADRSSCSRKGHAVVAVPPVRVARTWCNWIRLRAKPHFDAARYNRHTRALRRPTSCTASSQRCCKLSSQNPNVRA